MKRYEIAEHIVTDEKGFYVAKIGQAILKLNDTSLEGYLADGKEITVDGNQVLSYQAVVDNYYAYTTKKKAAEQAAAFFDAFDAL